MQESWEGWRGRQSFSRSPMEERECRKTTSGSIEQVRKKGAFYRPHKNIAVATYCAGVSGSRTPEPDTPPCIWRILRSEAWGQKNPAGLRAVSDLVYWELSHSTTRSTLDQTGVSDVHTPECPVQTHRSIRRRHTGVSGLQAQGRKQLRPKLH